MEFASVALLFFLMIFGIIEFGRLLYTHNALTDATRRGARYAVINQENADKIKDMVVYGKDVTYDADGVPQGSPVMPGLATGMVNIVYEGADIDNDPDTPPTSFGMNLGTATVSITGYTFNLALPFVGRAIPMPDYTTTLTAESAGEIPPDIAGP